MVVSILRRSGRGGGGGGRGGGGSGDYRGGDGELVMVDRLQLTSFSFHLLKKADQLFAGATWQHWSVFR